MMMKRNRRLLLKTAKRIEEVPESYNQAVWADKDYKSPCGTVACLAGEMIICSERSLRKGLDLLWDANDIGQVPDTAQRMAGLTDDEASDLFYSTNWWPTRFHNRYERASTQRGRAKVAAALLRYLADGGQL